MILKRFLFLVLLFFCRVLSAAIITPYPEIIDLKQINGASKEQTRHCQTQAKFDRQPTGFYIEKGKKVVINVEILSLAADNAMPTLTIGTLGFNVGGRNTADGTGSINPQNFQLTAGANTITAPYGGLIYLTFLVNSAQQPTGVARITFTEASEHVRAPRYIYGVTTDAEFKEMLAEYETPDVIFHSDYAIVAATREMALDNQVYNENKNNWMNQLHKLIELEDEISGMNNDDPNPVHHRLKAGEVRFLLVQNTNSSPHASSTGYTGYPNNLTYGRRYLMMFGSSNNSWLLGHEIGHQHQQSAYLINKATESTVNIYSYVVERDQVERVNNNPPYHRTPETTWTRAQNNYLSIPVSDRIYDMDDSVLQGIAGFGFNELRFLLWEQFFIVFGDQFYKNLHRIVREEKVTGGSEDERRAYLIWKASQVSGYDLTDFFNLWGIRVNDNDLKILLRKRIHTALVREEILPLPVTAEEMTMVTGQNRPAWTPLPLKGIKTSKPQYEGLDRIGWTIETSLAGVPDASFGGSNPYLIIDGSGGSQGFAFIKPGVTYSGITGPPGYTMSFSIDMQAKREFNSFIYSHRTSNTEARLRAREISLYGKNNEADNFEPIALNIKIATNSSDNKVVFDMVEYRYVQVVIEDWEKTPGMGNTVQVSDFRLGVETQEDLLNPDLQQYKVKVTTSEGVVADSGEFEVDEGDEFSIDFTLLPNYGNLSVFVDKTQVQPTLSDGIYTVKTQITNHTTIQITAALPAFTVQINRGAGIISITPDYEKVNYGSDFQATFVLASGYTNPVITGGEATIEENTIHISEVTSNYNLTLSASKDPLLNSTNYIDKQPVKIYPNPVVSGQMLTISAYNGVKGGKLKICGIDGKILNQKTIAGGTEKIEMNYPSGVYFLKIDFEDEETVYKIVVL